MSTRTFSVDDAEWVAWPSGGGAYGTGIRGLGNIEAIHFATAAAPETPLLEALLAAGTFWSLFDDELATVFRSARRVVVASELSERPLSRRNLPQ